MGRVHTRGTETRGRWVEYIQGSKRQVSRVYFRDTEKRDRYILGGQRQETRDRRIEYILGFSHIFIPSIFIRNKIYTVRFG